MASFRCYDNSDVIATLIMTNFHLNTTVVAIFPNACLWRRSLCSNLVLTLKTNCIKPLCQCGLRCCNVLLVSFRLFRKNLSNLRDFCGQMVYRPPGKKFPVRLRLSSSIFSSSFVSHLVSHHLSR